MTGVSFPKSKARKFRKYKKQVPKYIKKYVERKIDSTTEDKEYIISMPSIFGSISSGWEEFSCLQPAQGLEVDDRMGNRIRLKSIEIKGVICTGASGALLDDPYNVMRIVLGVYKGMAGVHPLTGVNIDAPVSRVSSVDAGASLEKLLFDKYICLMVTGTEKGQGDGYTPQIKNFHYYHRFKTNNLISFGNNTVTYPNRRLVLSMVSDSIASPNPGFIRGFMRILYEDA